MNEIVNVNQVSKAFQDKHAVKEASFSINKGEIVAILGPNGAGKTTTISMMLGLLKPTSGEVRLFNQNPDDKSVREKLGIMLQEVSVMQGLKVRELLDLVRQYYPKPLSLEEVIALTGLTENDLKTRAEKLSGGQKRRVSFALALSGNPELIILDEPTVGMDISSRNRFWKTIQTLSKKGKTIIFTTHYLQEADDVAERIILFNNGSIIADGTPIEIKARLTKQFVSFHTTSGSINKLYGHSVITAIFEKNDRVYVQTDDTDAVLALLFSENIGAHHIQIERGKLEEAFEQLTTEHKEVI
ncbi:MULTISPECIES: ABC transporter ATP-binding protein [Heyndrickxia]|jgi:ABC-2 type transport system ATP-binding protein|uniref:ABC transporter ATP-binding protein n=1 Tax=Heyndrickxia TaxID=2837504 RepID=UPI00217DA0BC|nr:ABC transporter ATP-binding protein [Heyndrickxia oleronia]MCI1592196.1 ABC transporter ATP-binding protein [Heyndrickxia oleronia]MCI1615312.1 ABC transporter ATP-binding protein [Heyndrickxia oleronia]MCI1746088.1 ABC transporter ATP-binding protein [Heyndrickxia oleronia]MCI1763437.1 ABC transporter ATP-binding protein [Heyndrickxia oleronia]